MKKKRKTEKKISAEEFDALADSGSDEIDQHLDWKNASQPGIENNRINMDFPLWMVNELDRQARYRGLSRQAYIKTIMFNSIRSESEN